MFEKSFLQSAHPTLRYISPEFGCRSPLRRAPSSGRNLPQIVTYILQKAFFKHALKLRNTNNQYKKGQEQTFIRSWLLLSKRSLTHLSNGIKKLLRFFPSKAGICNRFSIDMVWSDFLISRFNITFNHNAFY